MDIRYNIRMPAPRDGKSTLSEVAVSRIAGVDRNRRRVWGEAKLVRQRGRKGYEELDAVESAVLALLVSRLDYERAKEAWVGVRPALRENLMAKPLLAVFDEGRSEGALVHSAEGLFAFAGRRGRFQILEISDVVADATAGFRNAVEARSKVRN
jgi:hypothetical protein